MAGLNHAFFEDLGSYDAIKDSNDEHQHTEANDKLDDSYSCKCVGKKLPLNSTVITPEFSV